MRRSRSRVGAATVALATLLVACGGGGPAGPRSSDGGPRPPGTPGPPQDGPGGPDAPGGEVRAEECDRWPPTVIEAAERISTTVGDLTLSTWAPLVVRLEDALRLEVEVANAGAAPAEVTLAGLDLGWASPPPDPDRRWFTQLFDLGPPERTVPPGGSVVYAWHLDPEDQLEERGEVPTVTFRFTTAAGPAELSTTLYDQVAFGDPERVGLGLDARVDGVVTDGSGSPLPDVEVVAQLYTFKEVVARTRTDAAGRFAFCVPGTEDYLDRAGGRGPGYALATHVLARTEDGTRFGFASVAPARGETVEVTIAAASTAAGALTLDAETRLETRHGWFWAAPLEDGVVVVEARHPPELGGVGSVARVRGDGSVAWQVPTGDECWGFDVSVDGLVAVGCHDGSITVLDADGAELWSRSSQRARALYNRWARFSPDGATLLTGPLTDDAELLDARTGATRWGYSYVPTDGERAPEILRSAAFAPDGDLVLLGFAGGLLASVDAVDGALRWQGGFIGEFPLLIELDAAGNAFVAGKGREFASYAPDGTERWRVPVYEAVTTATRTSLIDGLVIGHTVNGSVYALDADTGRMVWWRKLGAGIAFDEVVESSGHNALDVDPTSGLIAHVAVIDARRDRGGSVLTVLTTDGSVVATSYMPDLREESGAEVEHVHRGGHGVAFLDDDRIAVAGGDGTVRLFRLER